MHKQYQNGSLHVVIILTIAILLLGGMGFLFWQNFIQPKPDQSNYTKQAVETSNVQSEIEQTPTKTLKLDTVSFTIPAGWSEVNKWEADPKVSLKAGVTLLPGEKLRTVYGDGTEYFNIYVSVYSNAKKQSPKEWFENDNGSEWGGKGILANEDTESSSDVNGYGAYSRHIINNSYQEVHYILSSNDRLVYINARTYEVSKELPGVGDFRKFEPTIHSLAHSVVIK